MPNIDPFILGPNLYDLDGLTHDLLTKMYNDHLGEENACSHRELCRHYFAPYPSSLEDIFLISSILQRTRGVLQAGGYFLDYRKRSGWFVVKTTAEAFDHLVRYTKREVRLHRRLQAKAFIAVGSRYQLPADDRLIQAIEGMTPAIEQLEEAVESAEPPQLEEDQSNENQE